MTITRVQLQRWAAKGSVKRQAVSLPDFSSKKASAFLDFPVWKINWKKLIKDYPEDVRSPVLFDHIDGPVKRRLVGYENNFKKAIEKMSTYQSNKL